MSKTTKIRHGTVQILPLRLLLLSSMQQAQRQALVQGIAPAQGSKVPRMTPMWARRQEKFFGCVRQILRRGRKLRILKANWLMSKPTIFLAAFEHLSRSHTLLSNVGVYSTQLRGTSSRKGCYYYRNRKRSNNQPAIIGKVGNSRSRKRCDNQTAIV